MSLAKSKDLRAKRAKLIEDARALIGGDAPSAEDSAKFDAMMVEADALKGQIDRIERADEAEKQQLEGFRSAGLIQGLSADEVRERAQAHDSAFSTYLRKGAAGLNAEQRDIYAKHFGDAMQQTAGASGGWTLTPRAAQGAGTDPAGGYTVPQGFYGQLIDAQLAYGGMIETCYVFDTASGQALPIPTDNDTTNKGTILGENVQASPQDMTFGAVNMGAYTYTSKLVLVSNQLLQDSYFNLDAFLSNKLGTRIARIINDHFTTGDGASKPSGVVGSSLNSATLGRTAGGATNSGSTAAISYDDLIELQHSVDPAYRGPNCRYMFADSTLKYIKLLKDTLNRPLWLPGIAVKEPDTINGYQYVVNQSMPALGTSNKVVAFGDFRNYFIRRVAGVQVLRLTERYADYNQVGFLAFQRWDGQLVDAGTHPIKYLQNSAS